MSRRPVMDVLDQILSSGRPADWRELAGLAVEFAPPHVARAIEAALSDRDTDPDAIRIAIDRAEPVPLDDTPFEIGSVEPESIDFEPVSLTDRMNADPGPIDLDFGAGTEAAVGAHEPDYDFGDELDGLEPAAADPHPEPSPDHPDPTEEALPFDDPFEIDDDSDDGEPFDD